MSAGLLLALMAGLLAAYTVIWYSVTRYRASRGSPA
jgi:hypothetical protein